MSYRRALEWIIMNDDTHWLYDQYGSTSVTAALVADLFRKDDNKVKEDLKKIDKKFKDAKGA